jgi:hypothetical protein
MSWKFSRLYKIEIFVDSFPHMSLHLIFRILLHMYAVRNEVSSLVEAKITLRVFIFLLLWDNPLRTAATVSPRVPVLDGSWWWAWSSRCHSFSYVQIPHELTQARTRAAAVRSWRLTASARPTFEFLLRSRVGRLERSWLKRQCLGRWLIRIASGVPI